MQTLSVLALSAALVVSASCARPTDLAPGYRVLQGDVEEATPLSRAVTIVADNQQHFLYGRPLWIRTAFVDRLVRTAIRAPQLDLFGQSALEWIVKNHSQKRPLVHLGDGLNLSCKREFDLFVELMDGARQGWFIAPGNHDGIYFGSSNERSQWVEACALGGGPIDQATFIERYLNEVLASRRASTQPAAPAKSDPGTKQFAAYFASTPRSPWVYSGNERAWLTRVAWRIDHQVPYHSYLVQELTASHAAQRGARAVKYILIDTSNYEHEPTLIPVPPHVNPGSTGDLRADQLKVVEQWLEAYVSSGVPTTVVLMGHHPFDELTERARKKLDELRRKFGVLTYVSAHTHRGSYVPHDGDESGWLELNVGSTVDWPLEFRSFELVLTPEKAGSVVYSNSELFRLGNDVTEEDSPVCAKAWQPQRGDPDYYIDYAASWKDEAATEGFIFNSLLNSYKRLLKFVPSDAQNSFWPPSATSDAGVLAAIDAALTAGSSAQNLQQKRDLLLALETFERKRIVPATLRPDPADVAAPEQPGVVVHRDYRLCQAIWASQDDETGARRARPEDWYISYPPRKVP